MVHPQLSPHSDWIQLCTCCQDWCNSKRMLLHFWTQFSLKGNVTSSRQVIQIFPLHFPTCTYPCPSLVPDSHSRKLISSHQGSNEQNPGNRVWNPFRPRVTTITSLIMNCSSVLQEMEVIASAGSNHLCATATIISPLQDDWDLAMETRGVEGIWRYGLILKTRKAISPLLLWRVLSI